MDYDLSPKPPPPQPISTFSFPFSLDLTSSLLSPNKLSVVLTPRPPRRTEGNTASQIWKAVLSVKGWGKLLKEVHLFLIAPEDTVLVTIKYQPSLIACYSTQKIELTFIRYLYLH